MVNTINKIVQGPNQFSGQIDDQLCAWFNDFKAMSMELIIWNALSSNQYTLQNETWKALEP